MYGFRSKPFHYQSCSIFPARAPEKYFNSARIILFEPPNFLKKMEISPVRSFFRRACHRSKNSLSELFKQFSNCSKNHHSMLRELVYKLKLIFIYSMHIILLLGIVRIFFGLFDFSILCTTAICSYWLGQNL